MRIIFVSILSISLTLHTSAFSYNKCERVFTQLDRQKNRMTRLIHSRDGLGPKELRPLKYFNMAYALMRNRLIQGTPFVRLIPTDKCNLKCKYCFQFNNDPKQMSLEEFRSYLAKARENGVGMITFLGGEPMTWSHLIEAVKEVSDADILTDMTTNGTRLTAKTIEQLSAAGLDFLNISVDAIGTGDAVSKKNSVIKRKELITYLRQAKQKYGMKARINSVLYKGNFNSIKSLIEFSKENNVPISLGYVVPDFKDGSSRKGGIYFTKDDTTELKEAISYIKNKKLNGYPIIDPIEYFEGMFRYLEEERFWECNYPSPVGWINVDPYGSLRSCTKKMDRVSGFSFLDLSPERVKDLKQILKPMVEKCNPTCYSNCAYDSAFYRSHKFKAVLKALGINEDILTKSWWKNWIKQFGCK